MKLRTIFLSLFLIVFLDFSLTVIGISLFKNFIETTAIHSYLFSLGWYGYIFSLLINAAFVFAISILIYVSQNIVAKKYGIYTAQIIPISIIIFFNILWSTTIVNNLKLLLK